MSEVIYLSGPIQGRPLAEVEEDFNHYAAKYRRKGFTVINPMDLDKGEHGTVVDGIMAPDEAEWRYFIHRDVSFILDPANNISRIYMLPKWMYSKGATLEMMIGEGVGMGIYSATTGEKI